MKLAVFVPGHEHDEGVAALRGERAVGLRCAVDRAEDIGRAVDGEIDFAAADAVDLAPFRIDAAEMGFEIGDASDAMHRVDRPRACCRRTA